jgi:hypothetical protein
MTSIAFERLMKIVKKFNTQGTAASKYLRSTRSDMSSLSTYAGFLSSELQLLEDHVAVPSFRYFKPRLLLAQRLAAHRLDYLRLLKQEVIPDLPEG